MNTIITSLLVAVVAALGDAKSAKLDGLRHVDIGQCPHVTSMQDFDYMRYLDVWYEVERFDYKYEEGVDCAYCIHTKLEDDVIKITNRGRNAAGGVNERVGIATVVQPGIWMVDYEGHQPRKYQVLETDYDNFATVYICNQINEFRFQYAWILSRNKTLQEESHAQAHKVFEKFGIDVSLFHPTHQGDDCPYVS